MMFVQYYGYIHIIHRGRGKGCTSNSSRRKIVKLLLVGVLHYLRDMIEVFICTYMYNTFISIHPAIFSFFFSLSRSHSKVSLHLFNAPSPKTPKPSSYVSWFVSEQSIVESLFFLGAARGGRVFPINPSVCVCVCVPRPIFAIGSLYESWARFFSRIGSGTAVWANWAGAEQNG